MFSALHSIPERPAEADWVQVTRDGKTLLILVQVQIPNSYFTVLKLDYLSKEVEVACPRRHYLVEHIWLLYGDLHFEKGAVCSFYRNMARCM